MSNDDLLERIAAQPVEGAEPAGPSLRYDDAFAALEAEIATLEHPSGAAVDWARVEAGSAALLADRSKDLLLAVWMVRAMWQQRGLQGLTPGLRTTRRMLERFWAEAHPQRVRARNAALAWLGGHLATAIDAAGLAADPSAASDSAAELEALIGLWSAQAPGEDCGLGRLLARLREAPAPGSPTAESAEYVPTGGRVASGPIVSTGPIASREQAVAALGELARWWARHEPSSPMVPLLNRAVAWSVADFPTVFGQLLRTRSDAREHLWDVLGIVEQPPT